VTTVTTSQPPTRLSRLTVLLYLNDDFEGREKPSSYQPLAEKKSYDDVDYGESPPPPSVIASVRPVAGFVMSFHKVSVSSRRLWKQWPKHEGAPVTSGSPKYVIRSDVLFAEQRGPLPLTNKFSKFDHLVRDAFLPSVVIVVRAGCLRQPLVILVRAHMGGENAGPLLYSLSPFDQETASWRWSRLH
jgi:hypothetical protein